MNRNTTLDFELSIFPEEGEGFVFNLISNILLKVIPLPPLKA